MYRELIKQLTEKHQRAKVQAPCSEKEIGEAERYVGFAFPEELKNLLREINGDHWFLLSAAEMMDQVRRNREIVAEYLEPEEFEVDVTTRIPLRSGESLNLRGRIDRLDTFEDEDKIYVKIMDYKSGSTSFDLALLYHGLQMQLVVYMDAALQMQNKKKPDKEAVPAGIFYYHIDDPVVDRPEADGAEAVEAEVLKKLRMNGLVNSNLDVIRHLDREIVSESDVIPVALKDGLISSSKSSVAGGDRFKKLSGFVNKSLKAMGEEILDGNTAVNPYKQGKRTACDYCPYHSICGFDLKTQGFAFRKFKSLKADQIWAKIEEEHEGGAADGERDMDNGTTAGH